jgi:hypothetical protein
VSTFLSSGRWSPFPRRISWQIYQRERQIYELSIMRLRFLASEFSCKIPFGVSKVEIDEKEGFKKGFRGIGDFFKSGWFEDNKK